MTIKNKRKKLAKAKNKVIVSGSTTWIKKEDYDNMVNWRKEMEKHYWENGFNIYNK